MHRIPLLSLESPSISWDREEPDHVLFNKTLNVTNVMETNNFLDILDQESDNYSQFMKISATKQMEFIKAKKSDANDYNSISDILYLLKVIVLRAPKESRELIDALKIRGDIKFKQFLFHCAAKDYQMFLHIGYKKKDEKTCLVIGCLVICLYKLSQYRNAKKYIQAFGKCKAKLPNKSRHNKELLEIEDVIKQFENELNTVCSEVPQPLSDVIVYIPFKGFNMSSDIPLSSASCYYASKRIGNKDINGVYTVDEIPTESIVLVEHPIVQSINIPFAQCEICFQQQEDIYTCLECRLKTYCSIDCMEKDKMEHQFECVGYRNLLLIILDAGILFRVFLRISSILKERIFSDSRFRELNMANMILSQLETTIKETSIKDSNYLKLVYNKPDYKKLTNMQYSTLIVTAFRLTIFIEKNTNIFDIFYKRLRISNKQKMILVGTMLMRLNCHLLCNTIDCEYKYLKSEKSPVFQNIYQQINYMADFTKPVFGPMSMKLEEYYQLNSMSEINKRYESFLKNVNAKKYNGKYNVKLAHSQPCDDIYRTLSTYKDRIADIYLNNTNSSQQNALLENYADKPISGMSHLICGRIAKMNANERALFVQSFANQFHVNLIHYFLQLFIKSDKIRQVISLYCSTLRKFRHSCVPNVEIIILENGVVLGKALRNIAIGEELVVSYKANHMRHARLERSTFLQNLNIQCHCKFCKMPAEEEPINKRMSIYCDKCKNVELTPQTSSCGQCGSYYNNLLIKYQNELIMLKNALNQKLQSNDDHRDRELYILHQMCILYVRKHYSPFNELRIFTELEFAQHLALKNFSEYAYDIIMELKQILPQNYKEQQLLFTFYSSILLSIKIILYYNIEKEQYSISLCHLRDLCEFGLYILNEQKTQTHFFETFDKECVTIMDDLQTFITWSELISFMEFNSKYPSM